MKKIGIALIVLGFVLFSVFAVLFGTFALRLYGVPQWTLPESVPTVCVPPDQLPDSTCVIVVVTKAIPAPTPDVPVPILTPLPNVVVPVGGTLVRTNKEGWVTVTIPHGTPFAVGPVTLIGYDTNRGGIYTATWPTMSVVLHLEPAK